MSKINNERTLVIIKPDAVNRLLVGEIVKRIERAQLKIKAMKMIMAPRKSLEKHYTDDESYLKNLGQKSLSTYKQYSMDPVALLGTDNDLEIGTMVREWLVNFMMSGPVIPMVIEGNHAIDAIRALAGQTIPLFADVGSIRGDFACDSPDTANAEKRAVANLLHASGNPEEAEQEIKIWFKPEEIID